MNEYNAKKIKKILPPTNNGQAIMMFVTFFVFISLAIIFGSVGPLLKDIEVNKNSINSTKSFFTAESGTEDVYYRLKNGLQVSNIETVSLNNASTTILISDINSSEKEIVSMGDVLSSNRKMKTTLNIASGTSFNYGVQVGAGGLSLKSAASVNGNVYSNGSITGDYLNLIAGDAISAGSTGSIYQINPTGSAYANSISSSNVLGDAYYQTITNTNVGGTSYPGSSNLPTISMPITDATIDQWKAEAEAGGVINTCPYNITSNVTLGPVKINCKLKISGGYAVTLTGNVWVVGKIEIKNTATIQVSPSLGSASAVMIADDPADRTEGSSVEIKNITQFNGSGQAGSYVMMVSMNNSAETMQGGETAMDIKNSVSGDLILYAPHGDVKIRNGVNLKGLAAYAAEIKNLSVVNYESGLMSLLFSSGPGGSWNIKDWKEIK
jgi:hypothetical protein